MYGADSNIFERKNADAMTAWTKVGLGIIAGLTITVLVLFPRLNPVLDVGLADFALGVHRSVRR